MGVDIPPSDYTYWFAATYYLANGCDPVQEWCVVFCRTYCELRNFLIQEYRRAKRSKEIISRNTSQINIFKKEKGFGFWRNSPPIELKIWLDKQITSKIICIYFLKFSFTAKRRKTQLVLNIFFKFQIISTLEYFAAQLATVGGDASWLRSVSYLRRS